MTPSHHIIPLKKKNHLNIFYNFPNLDEVFSKVGVEPAVEDGVADTGAHGDDVANTEGEVVNLEKDEVTKDVFNLVC